MTSDDGSVPTTGIMLQSDDNIGLDSIKFSMRHLLISGSIAFATIADGLNDNFVVFTHDELLYSCQTQNTARTCPNSTDIPCNPTFSDRPDMSPNQTSYAAEYSLVCEQGSLKSMLVSIMFFGVLCTSPLNFVTDLFGRKRVMMVSCLAQGLAILLASQSFNHWIYGGALFVSGLCGGLKYKAGSVLIAESVPIDYRDTFGTLFALSWSVGYAGTAMAAYLVPQWRSMVLYISMLSFVSTVVIHFCTLESTSWLFKKDRISEVKSNIRKLVPDNEELQDKLFTQLLHKNKTEPNPDGSANDQGIWQNIKMLTTNSLLWPKLLVNCYAWFAVSLLWRSFALGTSELEGSPYWNCFYSAAFDMVALFLSFILIKALGRRGSSTLCLIICAAFTCVCAIFSSSNFYHGKIVRWSALGSKLGFIGVHSILYIYTSEVFPTMQRSTALGVVGILDGLAAVVAPYFLQLRSHDQVLQYSIQTVLSVMAAVLILLVLPETMGMSLPSNEDDLRALERTKLLSKKRAPSREEADEVEMDRRQE